MLATLPVNIMPTPWQLRYKLATTTIPGLANNEGGLYGLSRVRVEPNLSLSGFQSLLENN